MGKPITSDLEAASRRHYVHHSYIWLGSLHIMGVMIAAIFVSIMGGFAELLFGDSEFDLFGGLIAVVVCVVGILAVGIIAFLYQWRSYKHLWYEIGNAEFSLYSGIFNKKRVHVPYQRVQSVDQHASLLQRIFGVCTVNIDTAGGAQHTAVRVPYVRKDQAEQLRMELYVRKRQVLGLDVASKNDSSELSPDVSAPLAHSEDLRQFAPHESTGNVLDVGAEVWEDMRGVFAGDAVDMGQSSFEYRLSNKELIFTGLSNNTGFVFAILGLLATIFQIVGNLGNAVDAASSAGSLVLSAGGRLFGGSIAVFAIVVVLIIVIVMWLISVFGACAQYGGFIARRRGNRIEVEHGLLKHQLQGVDVDRVQSVIIKQSVIRRVLGYCELSLGKIDAADSSQAGNNQGLPTQGLVIHPFAKLDKVSEILAGLVPEFSDIPTNVKTLPRVALRRAIVHRAVLQGLGFWAAVIVACLQILLNIVLGNATAEDKMELALFNTAAYAAYVVCALVFIFEIVSAVMWARKSSFAYNRTFMQITNEGLSRETVNIPRKKIQFGLTKTNPFQRRVQTATIVLWSAAGMGGTKYSLIDVCEEDADAWLRWMRPHGNVVS